MVLAIKWILTKKEKQRLEDETFLKIKTFRLKAKFSSCKKEQKCLCIKN